MADSSAELAWSIEEVGAWIEELGFPMYKVRAPCNAPASGHAVRVHSHAHRAIVAGRVRTQTHERGLKPQAGAPSTPLARTRPAAGKGTLTGHAKTPILAPPANHTRRGVFLAAASAHRARRLVAVEAPVPLRQIMRARVRWGRGGPSSYACPRPTVFSGGHLQACFVSNFVAGKDLPTVNASKLPKLGVTDHKHIGVISKAIRDKFGLLEPDWGRSVADVMWSPQNSLEGCAEGYGQGNTRAPAIDPTPRWQQIQQEQAQQA